jgi:LmbE family N-acetylglucosaminyl deacetylase
MKILVVAAHPDDEVLGCGGTIARLARENHDVYLLILGEGITSRCESRSEADPRCLKQLEDSSRQAATVLGVKDIFFQSLPDNRFDTIPILDIIKIIERTLVVVSPEAIFTQHGGDLNIDHTIVYRSVITAARPAKNSGVEAIYTFEVPSSTDWAFNGFFPQFQPNVFFDISNTISVKIEALRMYHSEMRTFPHPRSDEFVISRARYWGGVIGADAAEAFQLIRLIK